MNSKIWLAMLLFAVVVLSAGSALSLTPPMINIKVDWHGHSCFTLTYAPNMRLVIDSYTPGRSSAAPYKTPQLEGEIVLVTHEHFDHNNTAAVKGNPKVIRGAGYQSVMGLNILGIDSWHDGQIGQSRGANTIFIWNGGGVNFAHLGDLGQKELTAEQLKQINRWGAIDVLFIPVGGHFTIGPEEAGAIVEQIKPKIVVPMHYRAPGVAADNPLVGVEKFLEGKKNVKHLPAASFVAHRPSLPKEREIWVMSIKELLK